MTRNSFPEAEMTTFLHYFSLSCPFAQDSSARVLTCNAAVTSACWLFSLIMIVIECTLLVDWQSAEPSLASSSTCNTGIPDDYY